MSEDLQKKVKELTDANENLNKQITQMQAGVEGLLSQIDAHREQINESVTAGLNIRANMMHLKKHNNKLTGQMDELKKYVETVNKQLADANKRIAELEAPKLEVVDAA